jgi:hypothetical protein
MNLASLCLSFCSAPNQPEVKSHLYSIDYRIHRYRDLFCFCVVYKNTRIFFEKKMKNKNPKDETIDSSSWSFLIVDFHCVYMLWIVSWAFYIQSSLYHVYLSGLIVSHICDACLAINFTNTIGQLPIIVMLSSHHIDTIMSYDKSVWWCGEYTSCPISLTLEWQVPDSNW